MLNKVSVFIRCITLLDYFTWCQKFNLKMAKFPPPEKLDFTRPEWWLEWCQHLKRFRTATKLQK